MNKFKVGDIVKIKDSNHVGFITTISRTAISQALFYTVEQGRGFGRYYEEELERWYEEEYLLTEENLFTEKGGDNVQTRWQSNMCRWW